MNDRTGHNALHPTADGFQAVSGAVTVDGGNGNVQDFTESQRAGLAAVLSLAKAEASSPPPAVMKTREPPPQFFVSPPGCDEHEAASGHAARLAAGLASTDVPEAAIGGQQDKPAHLRLLLLIAILTIQALLSLRLVWSNTSYIDEATYLWAGHLEISHWLHGTPVPPFQTWFSGAPVIYPPVGAVADSLGGVAGARILSLVFMTAATALLWNISLRLFGGRVAFFAAAVFALLGPTQFLGALATYDAMALFLLAISTWCVVAARDHGDSTGLLVASAVVLALANATKYATTLFDPVVIILAAVVIAEKRGAKPSLGRAGYIAAVVTALVAALLALGGPLYLAGVMYTTLARSAGDNSPALVLEDAWKWTGVVWILAGIGVIICIRRGSRAQLRVLTLLAAAGMLAPLEQARIHTITSLHKHVDFGAWLAAPAAGYALSQISQLSKLRSVNLIASGLVAAATTLPVGSIGSAQAATLFRGWPDSSTVVAKLRVLTRSYPGNYLAEDYDIPAYYMGNSIRWQRWSNTWFFSYAPPGARHPLTGVAAYREAIARHYFSLVLLDFGATPRTDRQISAEMQSTGGYQIVAVVPSSFGRYTVWARQPGQSRNGNDHS